MASVKFAYKTKYNGVIREAFEVFEVPDDELHKLENEGAIVVVGKQSLDASEAPDDREDKPKRKGKA